MAKFKLEHLFTSLRSDILKVANFYEINILTSDAGKSGLKTMYDLLSTVCRNRVYDDHHPAFASGAWKRVLPFDGRDYCFFYENDANDTHVVTLLRRIKDSL